MLLFWERGFEGTSMDELTAAMGMSPSSLYSAFGSKDQLYREAVDRYDQGPGAYGGPILSDAKTAREAIRARLEASSREFVRPDQPFGCMVAASALHGSPASMEIRADIARRRSMALASFRERIEQGKRDGDVAADVDPAALADFYMTVLEGLTVHARDGASVDRLLGIVATAMRAWPD